MNSVKRREAKMYDFNVPTEHTLVLHIIGKVNYKQVVN